ncbi:TRAP transporter substrate-binding protein [Herbaspirillum sp.]|uniref:TRAP transporter substrate-binding protein n=1 Tax=Herbaspirillum sp. TaxID=1890675 RepID=UPI001B000F66|nr:TRAP transporter substrate-binding protein [Herbaspirillum sp.]MBO9538941.1 TRAP transporter substrate-binding protein [Herbaspirillum sp.]
MSDTASSILLLRRMACAAAISLLPAASVLAQAANLRLINEYPAASITASADLRFAASTARMSNGEVAVTTLQEAANPYKGRDQVAAVSEGRAEIGTLFAGILGGSDPFFLLSSLPFLVDGFEQAQALFTCTRPELERHLAALNLRLLYATPWPPSGIWSARPVADIAALKALDIRTYDDNSRGVFQRVGARSANLPFSALVAKLASGELNAALSSGDGGAGNRLWDHLGHFTAISYAIPLSYTVVNLETWNRLTPQQQAALTRAAQATEQESWSIVKNRIQENYARMSEHGMRLDLEPAAEVRQALRKAGQEQADGWWPQQDPDRALRTRCMPTG